METRRFVAVACALAALQLSATTYTWTGASANNQDGVGKWTDAGNWSVGGAPATDCPGRYLDADGVTILGDHDIGAADDIAVFTAVGAGAATVIDLTGHVSIYCVAVTGADAPSYTFGTAADQMLRIESRVSSTGVAGATRNYKFIVESDVVNPQTIVARFGAGYGQHYAASVEWSYCALANFSAAALDVGDFGFVETINTSADGSRGPYTTMFVCGEGKVNFNGGQSSSLTLYPDFRDNADVTFRKSFTAGRIFTSGTVGPAYMRKLEIAEGATITMTVGGWSGIHCANSVTWCGLGALELNPQACFEETSDATDIHQIDCYVFADGNARSSGISWVISCSGLYNFTCPSNGIPAGVIHMKNTKTAADQNLLLGSARFGRKGDDGGNRPLGRTYGVLCHNCSGIRFNGTEPDTTDFDLMIADGTPISDSYTWGHVQSELVVDASGTAPFTVESELIHGYVPDAAGTAKAYCGTNTLHLAGDGTGGGIWNSVLSNSTTVVVAGKQATPAGTPVTLAVRKTGTGRWTLPLDETYTGDTTLEGGELLLTGTIDASRVVFKGGTLVIPAGTAKTLFAPVIAASGASRIVLEPGATLTVTTYDDTGAGTVDIIPGEGSSVVFSEKVGTTVPALSQTLRMNGVKVFFDAAGKPVRTVGDVEPTDFIDVKGGVVPDKASGEIAILDGGEGGDITLAADTTTVTSLSQFAEGDEATVSMPGQTLVTKSLNVALGAKAMTVGAGDDPGTLKALPDGDNKWLSVTVDGPESVLTVDAAVKETGRIYKYGDGKVSFSNADQFSNTIYAYGGLLEFVGKMPNVAMTVNAETSARVRLADAEEGETAGFYTSVVRTQQGSDTEAALVLENVSTFIKQDKYIQVGSSKTETEPASISRLRMTNARLCGNTTNETGTISLYVGYGYGDGTFQLEGDSLYGYGMHVGYTGRGAVYQDGGTVTYTNTSWSGHLWLASQSRVYGYYALADGRFDAQGSITTAGSAASGAVFHQTGGDFYCNTFRNTTGNGGDLWNLGLVRHSGGTATYEKYYAPKSDSGSVNDCAVLVVDGGDVTVSTMSLLNGTKNNECHVVLNGGRLTVPTISISSSTGYGLEGPGNRAYLSFDGGVYAPKATSGGRSLVSFDDGLERATVHAGGAIFDVPENVTLNVNEPLLGPEKKGVASVPWTGFPNVAENAFIGPPAVRIIGDGSGAIAAATYDRANQSVTGVEVLCPGSGYTWAKAVFYYGSNSSDAKRFPVCTNDCALTEGVPAAGLIVKRGAGELSLTRANTVRGVSLEAGTVVIRNAAALPDGCDIQFKGGAIAAAEGYSIPPVTLALKVGETQDCQTAFAFPEGSKVSVAGLDALDENVRSYKLITFPAGYTGSLALADGTVIPEGWKLSCGSRVIRLSKISGAVLLVR